MRRNEKVYKRRRIAVACVAAVVVLAAAVGLTLLLHPSPHFTFDGEKAAAGTITVSSADISGELGRVKAYDWLGKERPVQCPEIGFAGPGEYPLTLTAEDGLGKQAQFTLTVVWEAAPEAPTEPEEEPETPSGGEGSSSSSQGGQSSGGNTGEVVYSGGIVEPASITPEVISNPSAITAIVNKYHALPEGYTPSDLVAITTNCGKNLQLRKEAAESWEQMMEAAKADGITLKAVSAYRTKDYQNGLFTRYTSQYGKEYTAQYSAYPRRSEHELGLALDISNTAGIPDNFETTAEGKWLMKNAHNYGFILRYPEDKVKITQYGYEPWHYRYLGKDLAETLYKSGQTYEEYLGVK
ncbi:MULTISPECIES: M15 family metallopeptidase [Eubacteriales]|uniref:D-alanyl-D-alanine carboxypeptidase-like core domain-containing protein n=1 Tax=Bittarella massiliensis (ex Durand et al. 2017) TaxID=1720313 RepID=A0ABW9WX81_9FIRM|nr:MULTISPECIES: M15 family metallopeptidase [Eubacteriales]MZL69830.1 hypothetical protein [Bittarella massiliensis (ex Durand et al. 2017)]MZL81435.1 hypothetical protein [Bittarella massiliensis (ex Durand et al. 2017)]